MSKIENRIPQERITTKGEVKQLNLDLYRSLYLIRCTEQKICEHYSEDEMKSPMHMSMGGEAISAGVCAALHQSDQVFSSYRSHAAYLAKTRNVDNFFAEMYGKETALLRGKGGSMHLCDPDLGFMGTSAIVASIIPVAVGASYANKVKGNGKVTVVFFGDGATEEGVFLESVNAASVMQLPVLFVCEDNELAVHTYKNCRQGHDSITDVVSHYNCDTESCSTTDVEEIYDLTRGIVQSVRERNRPGFLHLNYYRYLEHVGIDEDFDAGYRPKKESEVWKKKDPVKLQRDKLLSLYGREEEILDSERETEALVCNAIALAQAAQYADIDELYKDVVCGVWSV